ncbi:hypothetical protein NKH77_39530 [Streptomyces sp. M19]
MRSSHERHSARLPGPGGEVGGGHLRIPLPGRPAHGRSPGSPRPPGRGSPHRRGTGEITGANGPYLERVLRYLATRQMFREDEEGAST